MAPKKKLRKESKKRKKGREESTKTLEQQSMKFNVQKVNILEHKKRENRRKKNNLRQFPRTEGHKFAD